MADCTEDYIDCDNKQINLEQLIRMLVSQDANLLPALRVCGDSGGGGGGLNLAGTLSLGNLTGSNDIIMSDGQVIKAENGSAFIDLRANGNDESIRAGVQGVELEMFGNNPLDPVVNIDVGSFSTTPNYVNAVLRINTIGFSIIKSDFTRFGGIFVMANDTQDRTTAGIANYPVFASVQGGKILQNVPNVFMAGAKDIIAKTPNAIYTNNLIFNKNNEKFEIALSQGTPTADRLQTFQNLDGAITVLNSNFGLEINTLGSTPATKGLSVYNFLGLESFYIDDDGKVSAKDGYSINGTLFAHATFNGTQDFGGDNTFIGELTPTTAGDGGTSNGIKNVGIGSQSLQSLTLGRFNSAIGSLSLSKITVGRDNTAVGNNSLVNLIDVSESQVSFNTAIGSSSFQSLITGVGNTGVGILSGANITGGVGNTIIGSRAGANTLGSYNHSIAIGRLTKIDSSNQCVIGTSSGGAYINEFYFGIGVQDHSIGITPINLDFKVAGIADGKLDESPGYDWRHFASGGTGTGKGGEHQWFTAPATTTGTAKNPDKLAMTIQEDGVVVYKDFLKASLPTPVAGGMIRVSDEIGGDTLAYSNGINWLRMSDGTIVS